MNGSDLDKLSRTFGIYDIEEIRKPQTYDYNFVDDTFSSLASHKKYATIHSSYRITVEKEFIDSLLEASIRNDIKNGPSFNILYEQYKDVIRAESREKELQKKYPELAEIMKDYEIMKALILQKE
jgi:hypothetical protein